MPGALLPLVIALEVGGALAIIVGWQTRIVAFLLAGFALLSALIFHSHFADQVQMIMFWKNVAIAGGFLLLVAHGAGPLSLDAATVNSLIAYLEQDDSGNPVGFRRNDQSIDKKIRGLIHLIMCLSEFQLN